MSIQNKDSYRDNPLLKKVGVEHEYTEEQVQEYIKCSKDPIHFCRKYIKIVNVDQGLINFDMWPFQEEMLNLFKDNRFVITKCPRQVGKTTTTVGYLLWATIFTDSQNVAVLANKGSLARDILSKYQLAYENLPQWLQQGVVTWNKGNVELENGSKVIAASTSSSAIRGGSFNIVFLDEFAFVPNNIANEFFNSVYPVISSGKSSKIIIVSTPNGMNLFYKLWMDSIEGRNNYKNFQIHWSMVPGRDDVWKEETIRNTSERQFSQEFETEFLGSSNTLISGYKLQQLRYINPIADHDKMKIYENPIKEGTEHNSDHLYCICVDVSEGKNLDSSAFSVIDIDHTICIPNDAEKDTFEKYGKAKPIKEMIDAIRKAKQSGYRIVLFTARRMATHNGDINKVIEDVGELTINWLKEHDVPYDELQFGKPNAVYYVDDKALLPNQFIEWIMRDK